jgi:hypothetical protein
LAMRAPISMARSRMPQMPLEDDSAPGGRPRPSSRTVRTTVPLRLASRRSTRLACAWRAMFGELARRPDAAWDVADDRLAVGASPCRAAGAAAPRRALRA